MIDYGELFCEAVDTIVQERLTHVSFDKTILCTIVDDTNRSRGLYTVTENDNIKFEAYSSDTSYRKGNNVYVQIPGGDWNQQKIIISKKTTDTIEPYTYQEPLSHLVDITGNIINGNPSAGLIANAKIDEVVIDPYKDEYQCVTLWSYSGNDYAGYTRLGIQAQFQSWLNPFHLFKKENEVSEEEARKVRRVSHGEYGLRARITATLETTSKEESSNELVYELYLNQEDMNGNPYDFETYFTQEKLFDISHLGTINRIEIQFYQVPGTFTDGEKEIPYKDFLDNYITPNLFIKDIYIGLGYGTEEFDKELIKIYTLDTTTYSRTMDPLENNHKKIQLRWIQKQADGSFKSITERDGLNFELRWYRYQLGASSADKYSGVYWSSLSTQNYDNEDKLYNYNIEDAEWQLYNKVEENDRAPDFFTSWLLPDTTLQDEQIKAILFYNGEVYRSNILLFTNEDEVVSKPTVDVVQALSINCEDDTFGNYRIYNLGNMLIDHAQGQQIRTLRPYFKTAEMGADAAPVELTEAESIEWIIPTEKTMIVLDDEFKSGGTLDDNKRIHIIRYGEGPKNNNISGINTQSYRIRSYYSQNYSNNTIQCKVVKDKITYTATKEFTFGPAGTSGSDCTFILDFENGNTAVTVPSTTTTEDNNTATTENDEVNNENNNTTTPENDKADNKKLATFVKARLYDYENNEITDLSKYTITWSWYSGNDLLEIIKVYERDKDGNLILDEKGNSILINDQVEIKLKENAIAINYHILQATLTGWGDYDLVAYLPIPIRSSKDYHYISGTTQIIYDSAGKIMDYFKNPYVVYGTNGPIKDVYWTCGGKNPDPNASLVYYPIYNKAGDGEKAYTPSIMYSGKNKEYSLQPPGIYIEGANKQLCVTATKSDGNIIWSQPILVLQNRYPSAMLNKWDGELKIEAESNSILAAQIAAGRKESDNSFTGVILGDWGKSDSENSITANTGLYGFHQGKQSFGFKDDGTAFIGKSGAGRLLFDGTKSVITSNRFADPNEQGGMQLDFDDGLIEMKHPDGALSTGTITLNASAPLTPFTIGTNFSVDWNGTLNAENGVFSGKITADSGKIGGWIIRSGTLSSSVNTKDEPTGLILSSSGSISAKGDDNHTWTIDSGGNAFFNYITAEGGTIGGCPINLNYLSSFGYTDNGSGGWKITSGGDAIFRNITATGGSVGGCSIEGGVLKVPAANITGTLTASQINASDLKVDAANITGKLTVGQIEFTSGLQQYFTETTMTLVKDVSLSVDYIESNYTIEDTNGTVRHIYTPSYEVHPDTVYVSFLGKSWNWTV